MPRQRVATPDRVNKALELIKDNPGITGDQLSKELGIFPYQLSYVFVFIKDMIVMKWRQRVEIGEGFGGRVATYYLK